MSAAVAVIRRLWTRDTSKQRKPSDASATLESPSTPASTDQTFAGSGSDSHRRGENPDSDYSGSSAATGAGKLSRALSQRFRATPSRRPSEASTSGAISIKSGKQQKPTVCRTFHYTAQRLMGVSSTRCYPSMPSAGGETVPQAISSQGTLVFPLNLRTMKWGLALFLEHRWKVLALLISSSPPPPSSAHCCMFLNPATHQFDSHQPGHFQQLPMARFRSSALGLLRPRHCYATTECRG